MAPDMHDRTSLATGPMSHRSPGASEVRHGGMSVMSYRHESYRQESYRQESRIRRHRKLYGLIRGMPVARPAASSALCMLRRCPTLELKHARQASGRCASTRNTFHLANAHGCSRCGVLLSTFPPQMHAE